MSRVQLILFLFGISASFFVKSAEARSSKHLEGEAIQGGDVAMEGQVPYQVSLQYNGLHICGGSILSERFVITGAHCIVDEGYTDSLKVIAGTTDLKAPSIFKVVIDVIKAYVPREYNPMDSPAIGDIALLELNRDLGIMGNPMLVTVNLPKMNENYNRVQATVSGFGYNSVKVVTNPETGKNEEERGRRNYKLRFATANVLNSKDCQLCFSKARITEKHVCAALVQRNKSNPEGLCIGDSGGPLVYNGVQIGVVSVSPFGCREKTTPAVYTRVSYYIDFINKVIYDQIDYSILSIPIAVETERYRYWKRSVL